MTTQATLTKPSIVEPPNLKRYSQVQFDHFPRYNMGKQKKTV